jgi:hypothetical protein
VGTDLTYRAERALLGALISDPGLVPRLVYLEPGDFTDDVHRAVYTAVRSLGDAGAPSAAERIAAVARAAGLGVSEEYVHELAASCPDPHHGTAYGLRLVQAALYRQMAERADILGAQASLREYDGARVAETDASGRPGAREVGQHLGLVSAALRRQTAPLVPGGPAGAPTPESGQPAAPQDQGAEPGRPASGQERREEHVLTALLQQHRESDQILAFLPAAAFSSPDRQETFRAIRRLRQASQPVDELTVIWELGTASDTTSLLRGGPDLASGAYANVMRLAKVSGSDQSPRQAARELLTQLDRRTISTQASSAATGWEPPRRAQAAQPGQGPGQASPSPTARSPVTQPPPGANDTHLGREPRR